ncbi:hypothetical protein EAI26_03765 [Lactobacillus sp. 0.1XD8-4]|uniref:Uncharacterized protein n=1 Tax=Limosilactobacillus walteri TaxID=2268022 RepID=A0ABR8P8C8_9LACO|nr:hypothetical protein [Limosilactobacillus walteri]MBD5806954.1 hypothetical protein [Limosilactobacillus walteri]MRN06516.1 hypothetical protein [Lactobacillus sp. 0.1XD8-4]
MFTASMFTGTFSILVLWLIVDIFWILSRPKDIVMRRICAWINLIAIIGGFSVFYGVTHLGNANIVPWFICLNWLNVIAAGFQFYFGYARRFN